MLDNLLKMAEKENKRQDNIFLPEFSKDEYWKKLKNKAEFDIHVLEGVSTGFVAFYCNNNVSKESFISLILVSSEFRGKKIGSGLVDYVLAISRLRGFFTCSLEVKKINKIAINLYKSKGFSISEERNDSFIMRADLI